MIKKIISGGQTGADRAGLDAAKDFGIETGGYAPKNYRTENGHDYSLKDYNLIEHKDYSYPPRTKLNISQSDGTIIFGKISGGSKLTLNTCRLFRKPDFHVSNPQDINMILEVISWLETENIEILNVAGNRESTNPGIYKNVYQFISELLRKCQV